MHDRQNDEQNLGIDFNCAALDKNVAIVGVTNILFLWTAPLC